MSKYTVTIAFNHGRDEQSRRTVSTHRSAHVALIVARRVSNDNGWAPRIECASAALLNELCERASELTALGAHDYRECAERAIVVDAK